MLEFISNHKPLFQPLVDSDDRIKCTSSLNTLKVSENCQFWLASQVDIQAAVDLYGIKIYVLFLNALSMFNSGMSLTWGTMTPLLWLSTLHIHVHPHEVNLHTNLRFFTQKSERNVVTIITNKAWSCFLKSLTLKFEGARSYIYSLKWQNITWFNWVILAQVFK